MPSADDVANLVRDRIGEGRASVMNDHEGLLRRCRHARSQSANLRRRRRSERRSLRVFRLATPGPTERAYAIHHVVEMLEVLMLGLVIFDLLPMYKA